MVAQRQRMIAHEVHDVGNILSFRNCSCRIALQEVTHADGSSVGSIRFVDGISQTGHLCVAVNATMYVILIQDDDALLG